MFSEVINEEERIISWRWLSSEGITLTGTAIILMSLLVDIFLLSIFVEAAISPRQFALHHSLFIVATLTFILNLAAAVYIMNRTIISIGESEIKIRHEPVPWLPAPTVKTSNIRKFEIIDAIKWDFMDRDNRTMPTLPIVVYKMVAIMSDGTRKTLFHGPRTREQAEFLKERMAHAD